MFYRNGSRLMSVPVRLGGTFVPGVPVPLCQGRFATVTVRGRYRPTKDGQRFLVLAPLSREAEQPAAVVLNWTSALPQ